MTLTIPRGELKSAVAGFSKIINGKSRNLPILGCIRIESAKQITAQANDLDQHATYRFTDAHADGMGVLIIPFQVIKDLAKGADAELIDLQAGSNDEITVTNRVGTHVLTHTVTGMPVSDWPPCCDDIQATDAEQFLPTYRRCVPFASSDQTRLSLNGIYIDLEGKGDRPATLVATDGRRLTCCNSMSLPIRAEHGVIVPITRFLVWSGLGDTCSIGTGTRKTSGWFCLKAGPWTYGVKLVDGLFPNWRQVLPNPDDMRHQLAFADADVLVIRKLLPTLPGGDGVGLVCTSDGMVVLTGRNAGDKAETSVPLTSGTRYTGKDARIQLNRQYLLDALLAGFRNFGFQDSGFPLRSDDGNGGLHVLMPQRIGTEAPVPTQENATAPTPETPIHSTPAADTPLPTTPKDKTMAETTTTEPTALEKMQATFEIAKGKIREASQALSDLAVTIKDATREDKARRTEVENVRAGLQKLQAIRV